MELPAPFDAVLARTLTPSTAGPPDARMDRDVFVDTVPHALYAGDTPLHLAAAMADVDATTLLLDAGTDPCAVNRRGATALHYACDPRPAGANWNPDAQATVIELLVAAGADINAPDRGGVTPLHRAVRSRSPRAVETLLAGSADPSRRTKRGTTPAEMAASSTGASGTADTADARQQILRALDPASVG